MGGCVLKVTAVKEKVKLIVSDLVLIEHPSTMYEPLLNKQGKQRFNYCRLLVSLSLCIASVVLCYFLYQSSVFRSNGTQHNVYLDQNVLNSDIKWDPANDAIEEIIIEYETDE